MTGLGLLLAVFGASVVGSLHCVGMCGGLVASVSGNCGHEARGRARRWAPLIAYQAARALAYTSLGAIAGLLGAGLDASAAIVGIQRVAGPLMGIVLISMAVTTLRGRPSPSPLISLGSARPRRGPIDRIRLRLATAVRERGASTGAAAGLLTALLPCGWLWAYLAVAASTGAPLWGWLVMLVFWLGSVPALLGVGLLAGELGGRLGRHVPRIIAVLLLALGILSLVGKLTLTASPVAEQSEVESPTSAGESSPNPASHELPDAAACH